MARGGRSLPLLPVGLFLLLLGAAWASIETVGYLPRFVALAGVLMLVLFVVQRAGEIRFLLLQARSHTEPGPTLTLLLAAGVCALGALLAARLAAPLDVTQDRLNSLSPASRATLAALQGPLQLEAFFISPSAEWDLAQRYLELYARSSPRVKTALRDPDRDPGHAAAAGVTRPGVVIIRYGEARTQVYGLNEEGLTQGILRVLEGRPRRIGLLQGHGEPSLSDGGDAAISSWVSALRDANIEVAALSLLDQSEVPAEIDALVLIHPRHPLYASEAGAIRRYLERGGHVGLWVEPEDSTGLEALLKLYYLGLLPGTIRDSGRATSRIGLGPWSPALVGDPSHEITAGLGTFAVASGARGLEIESPHPIDLKVLPFLKTAGTVETFRDPDRTGDQPLRRAIETVGVALEWPVPVGADWKAAPERGGLPPIEPAGRILVIGDASLLANRLIGVGSNRDLAVNSVHWLTFQERFLGIGRQRLRSAVLRIDRAGLRVLLYVVEFGLPLLLVLAGFAVWMKRRDGGRA